MVEEIDNQLTEEEKELYDRQIRLWGLEAQKRLRSARVLLIGVNGVGAEVLKNIILAGVNSVTLMDSESVTERDASSQFLTPFDQIGHNRAEASVGRARALNPLVKVSTVGGMFCDQPEGFLKGFDIVIATGLTHSQAIKVNNTCRLHSVKFVMCDVLGLFGFMLEDLQEHEFAEEVKILKPAPIKDGKRGKPEEIIKTVKRSSRYPSFEDVLDIDLSTDDNLPLLRKIDPAYFVVKSVLKFREEHERRDPVTEEDFVQLKSICDSMTEGCGYPKDKLSEELLRSLLLEVTNPSCAIMGGVVAQEVIKVISQVDAPLKNMFIFNPLSSSGSLLTIGC